jgi:anti-sigma-K factor RskA
MSPQTTDGGEPLDVLAAEHALGLLDGADRADAERRMALEPTFALAVETWQARLAAFVDETSSEHPPAEVWARIIERLGAPSNVVELRLRRSLAIWRGAAIAAAAVAATLAAALILPRPQPASSPLLMAKLSGAQSVYVAMFDPVRRQYVLAPVSVATAPGHSPELWLIPTGGKPIALGVAAFEKVVQLDPRAGQAGSGATLAVSIEPEGGSPTGQPTGPVVATGKLQAL